MTSTWFWVKLCRSNLSVLLRSKDHIFDIILCINLLLMRLKLTICHYLHCSVARIEKVLNYVSINFDAADHNFRFICQYTIILILLKCIKYQINWTRDDSMFTIFISVSIHRISFTSPSLSVGKDTNFLSINHRSYHIFYVFKKLFLVAFLVEDFVKLKPFRICSWWCKLLWSPSNMTLGSGYKINMLQSQFVFTKDFNWCLSNLEIFINFDLFIYWRYRHNNFVIFWLRKFGLFSWRKLWSNRILYSTIETKLFSFHTLWHNTLSSKRFAVIIFHSNFKFQFHLISSDWSYSTEYSNVTFKPQHLNK